MKYLNIICNDTVIGRLYGSTIDRLTYNRLLILGNSKVTQPRFEGQGYTTDDVIRRQIDSASKSPAIL